MCKLLQRFLQTTVAVPIFVVALFFGAMCWAKSEDPFVRKWFKIKTVSHGKVECVEVVPKKAKIGKASSFAKASSSATATADKSADKESGNPIVIYVHGSGDSLMTDGKALRQLAELGMVAVSLEYCQTNYEVFEEQFSALLAHVNKNRQEKASFTASSSAKASADKTADKGNGEREQCPMAWVGSSLGAQYTLRYLLEHPEQRPEVYVRLGGGMEAKVEIWKASSFAKAMADKESRNLGGAPDGEAGNGKSRTQFLLVHGERDDVFPAEECRRVAAMFATNGAAVDLKILPGVGHTFDLNRAQVIRVVGEYVKAHLTPEQPKPEFPTPPCYSFLVCAMPAFLWAGFWLAKRRKAQLTADYVDTDNLRNLRNLRLKSKFDIGLRVVAVVLAVWALGETAIHVVPPRLEVSARTLDIARWKLLAPKWQEDFAVLADRPIWQGQKLKTLLTHVELAHYCVYELINWKLPPEVYRDYVLSPMIEGSELELNWRRPLWEFYYPRIRKENTTEDAARIVARTLRERITVWPDFDRLKGVDTIWKEQVTGEEGFEKIYVATLRSVGVPARLDVAHKAEFWDGEKWRPAPRPLLSTSHDLRSKRS